MARAPGQLDLSALHIPERFGRITESWQPEQGPPRGLILHIQDLHTHPSTQFAIADLIDRFHRELGVRLVMSEGAAGLVDTTMFSDFPDPPSTERISRLFVDEAIFTGAEHYAITHPGDVTLWGVDDEDVYLRHLELHRRSAEVAGRMQATIAELRGMLETLRAALYPAKMAELERASGGK